MKPGRRPIRPERQQAQIKLRRKMLEKKLKKAPAPKYKPRSSIPQKRPTVNPQQSAPPARPQRQRPGLSDQANAIAKRKEQISAARSEMRKRELERANKQNPPAGPKKS